MPAREILAISNNLLEAMRFFGRARKDGVVEEGPGVCLISCGLNYAAFNAAVLSEPIGPHASELRQRIQIPVDFYQSRNLRWTYWLCDGVVDTAVRRQSQSIFSRFGLSPLTDPPGLYADCLRPPTRPLPSLQTRGVTNEQTRLAFAHITGVAFEIPFEVCREIYGGAQAWAGSFQGYVGYANGLPVTTAATVVTGDVAGIYSVATLPNHRGKGYAEAIMREALGQVRESTGIEATVLQSTTTGLPLYERMGYRQITRFSVYIG